MLRPASFRTHVVRRAHDALACCGRCQRVSHKPDKPEVGNFRNTLGADQKVCWLKITVKNSGVVGSLKTKTYISGNPQDVLPVELTYLSQTIENASAFEILH